MSDKCFIDTNIFIYAIDRAYPEKKSISQEVIRDLALQTNGIISTQVINEFYVTAIRKLDMQPWEVRAQVEKMSQFTIVEIDLELIKEAIDCSILDRISYWDALLVVCAARAGCDYLLTEDLNHGQMIKGVTARNIFKE